MVKLNLIEVHAAIQGEGELMGVPHILVRVSGCNMRCAFSESICDTPYASWAVESGEFTDEQLEEVYISHPQITHTMITGGEPFIDVSQLNVLVRIAKKFRHHVTVETNGSIPHKIGGIDLLSISPKLESSIPYQGYHVVGPKCLFISKVMVEGHTEIVKNMVNTVGRLIEHYSENRVYLKFVYTCPEDFHQITNFVEAVGIPESRVYLMPEGITNEQLQKRRSAIFKVCLDTGFRYSDRLHIVAYGDTRGT